MNDLDEIFTRAVETWGKEAQTDKAIEEMAELTKALLKYRLKPDEANLDNIIEEMADVSIMLTQLQKIYGSCASQKVIKANRLAKRLGMV